MIFRAKSWGWVGLRGVRAFIACPSTLRVCVTPRFPFLVGGCSLSLSFSLSLSCYFSLSWGLAKIQELYKKKCHHRIGEFVTAQLKRLGQEISYLDRLLLIAFHLRNGDFFYSSVKETGLGDFLPPSFASTVIAFSSQNWGIFYRVYAKLKSYFINDLEDTIICNRLLCPACLAGRLR